MGIWWIWFGCGETNTWIAVVNDNYACDDFGIPGSNYGPCAWWDVAFCPSEERMGRAVTAADCYCDYGACDFNAYFDFSHAFFGNAVPNVCGDGDLDLSSNPYAPPYTADPKEQCDDGNLIDGDGCSSTCVIESGVAPIPGCNPDSLDCTNVCNIFYSDFEPAVQDQLDQYHQPVYA